MEKNNGGLSLGGLGVILFIVFLVLKLCNVIGWSWWWVFAPLWIPFGLVLAIWIVIGLIGLIAYLASDKD